jgi:hypothetical protein
MLIMAIYYFEGTCDFKLDGSWGLLEVDVEIYNDMNMAINNIETSPVRNLVQLRQAAGEGY